MRFHEGASTCAGLEEEYIALDVLQWRCRGTELRRGESTMRWLDGMDGDALAWLMASEAPAVRYRTLCELLEHGPDDPDRQTARSSIASHPPIANLLAAQKAAGYWFNQDYYLPKHTGTVWVLMVLADLGLTAENEHVRRACEYLFRFQRDDGSFCRRRRVAGRGLVWDDQSGPCTHARIVRFLVQFGYANDPRTRAAGQWMLEAQRDDGMWHCNPSGRYGCLRATLDVLRAAVLLQVVSLETAIQRGAAALSELLMRPSLSLYHVGDKWAVLAYPYFGISLISALEVLAECGYTVAHPKVAAAAAYLVSRQSPDGTWPLDQSPYRPPLYPGKVGEPNEWLTLDALRTLRLLRRTGLSN